MLRILAILLVLSGLALIGSACGPVSAQPGDVLFQDDFTQDLGGWQTGLDESGVVEYYAGYLRIFVRSPRTARLSTPGLEFEDVRLEADAFHASGPEDNSYGLVCRQQDAGNFYVFEISSDGYAGIGKYEDGKLTLLGPKAQLATSQYIKQGVDLNHLRADCIGPNLSFYANGFLIAEVEDDTFTTGQAGVFAGTLDEPGVDILFDNFSVLQP